MELFILEKREAPWGDYGDTLVYGWSEEDEERPGTWLLHHVGPDVPALFPSGLWSLIVSDHVRRQMEHSGLSVHGFSEVVNNRIVELDWAHWDRSANEPAFYPEEGEPEGYIMDRAHSPSMAEQIGRFWHIDLARIGQQDASLKYIGPEPSVDLFMATNKGYILATAKAKAWIEANCGEWVDFKPIEAAIQ